MRLKFALVFTLFSLFYTAESNASTYNLTLTDLNGLSAGTGSFGVNGPIANTGFSVFTEGGSLTSLNFLIGGNNFTLANDLTGASVAFDNGKLVNIAYLGSLSNFKLDLGTVGLGYAFIDLINFNLSSIGTISASPGVSATPLPPSWTLMLLGLVGIGFAAYRRKNSGQLAAA